MLHLHLMIHLALLPLFSLKAHLNRLLVELINFNLIFIIIIMIEILRCYLYKLIY